MSSPRVSFDESSISSTSRQGRYSSILNPTPTSILDSPWSAATTFANQSLLSSSSPTAIPPMASTRPASTVTQPGTLPFTNCNVPSCSACMACDFCQRMRAKVLCEICDRVMCWSCHRKINEFGNNKRHVDEKHDVVVLRHGETMEGMKKRLRIERSVKDGTSGE